MQPSCLMMVTYSEDTPWPKITSRLVLDRKRMWSKRMSKTCPHPIPSSGLQTGRDRTGSDKQIGWIRLNTKDPTLALILWDEQQRDMNKWYWFGTVHQKVVSSQPKLPRWQIEHKCIYIYIYIYQAQKQQVEQNSCLTKARFQIPQFVVATNASHCKANQSAKKMLRTSSSRLILAAFSFTPKTIFGLWFLVSKFLWNHLLLTWPVLFEPTLNWNPFVLDIRLLIFMHWQRNVFSNLSTSSHKKALQRGLEGRFEWNHQLPNQRKMGLKSFLLNLSFRLRCIFHSHRSVFFLFLAATVWSSHVAGLGGRHPGLVPTKINRNTCRDVRCFVGGLGREMKNLPYRGELGLKMHVIIKTLTWHGHERVQIKMHLSLAPLGLFPISGGDGLILPRSRPGWAPPRSCPYFCLRGPPSKELPSLPTDRGETSSSFLPLLLLSSHLDIFVQLLTL